MCVSFTRPDSPGLVCITNKTCTSSNAGDLIAQEGEAEERLYLVTDGRLDIRKHGVEIATATNGSFVGEVSGRPSWHGP